MHPWFKGFIGDIQESEGRYIVTGQYEIVDDDELHITELPIGTWTSDYKAFIEELALKEIVEDIKEYHTENKIHFVLKVPSLLQIEKQRNVLK